MTDTGSVTGPITEPASPAPGVAAGWCRTSASYPADATIPGLFAAQAGDLLQTLAPADGR